MQRPAPSAPPIPSVVAMLVCDSVITEAGTNKKTLVGVFDRWNVRELPTNVSQFWVYTRLTDAEGKYIFQLKFVYLDEDKLLGEAHTSEISALDRLGFVELAFPVPFLGVEKAGRYEVQLYANDVFIGRSTMSVIALERK